jgi:hypothetical protein
MMIIISQKMIIITYRDVCEVRRFIYSGNYYCPILIEIWIVRQILDKKNLKHEK